MSNMLDFEAAILADDSAQVRDLLSEIDRKTESQMFLQAADAFGFRTVEHHGRRYAIRAEIARVMGYIDESGLRKLAERYDLEALKLASFGHDVRNKITKTLNLSPKAGRTTFVGWDTFLVAGMQGNNDAAKAVKLYLLKIERAGRLAAGSLDAATERSRRISDAAKVVSMVTKASREKNEHLRANLLRYIDSAVDGALNIPQQLTLSDD